MSSPTAHVHRLADGRAMGYAEFGATDGRPLVFCHGFASSRLAGSLLDAEAAALGLRVIAPDRPGHGLSDFKRRGRVAAWTTDVASLAEVLGIDRFAVLGFSAGGAYAAACAALLGDRVTVAGIASGWAPPQAPKTKPAPRLPFVPALGRHVRLLRRFALARVAKAVANDGVTFLDKVSKATPPADRTIVADATLRQLLADDLREAFRQGARGPARDARAVNRRWGFRLEDIRIPVWLWHGQEDRNVPPALARYVSERIPGSRTTLYRADGHLSTLVSHVSEILVALGQGGG
jgi:pimeloyl-ACP methyl ester carboxylesterase